MAENHHGPLARFTMHVIFSIICIVMFSFGAQARAAVLAHFTFSGPNIHAPEFYISSDTDLYSTASSFTNSAGEVVAYKSASFTDQTDSGNNAFQVSGATLGNWAVTLDPTKYYSFTVTPDTGYTLNLTQLDFFISRNANGPDAWQVRSSVDGFSSALGSGTGIYQGSPGAGPWTETTSLFSLQNASAVEFRIYGYEATGTGGGNLRVDDVILTGETLPIMPEPSTLILLGTACLMTLMLKRKRDLLLDLGNCP
jgi:hypothetical protein